MREVLERESVDLSNLQMAVKLVLEDLGALLARGRASLFPSCSNQFTGLGMR